jgi:hypothetical protein
MQWQTRTLVKNTMADLRLFGLYIEISEPSQARPFFLRLSTFFVKAQHQRPLFPCHSHSHSNSKSLSHALFPTPALFFSNILVDIFSFTPSCIYPFQFSTNLDVISMSILMSIFCHFESQFLPISMQFSANSDIHFLPFSTSILAYFDVIYCQFGAPLHGKCPAEIAGSWRGTKVHMLHMVQERPAI